MAVTSALLGLLIALIGPPVPESTQLPEVPASVTSVVSGGLWTAGDKKGTYRVVVFSHGYEHVSSMVRVEWLTEPSSPSAASSVVAKVVLTEIGAGLWSIGSPHLVLSTTSEPRLEIRATSPHDLKKRTFSFELGQPGEYRVRTEPQGH